MKNLYLATIVLAAAMLVTLPSTAQANLLANPGFEDGFGQTAWTLTGTSSIENWGGSSHSGTYLAAMSKPWAPGAGEVSQQVSGITAGAQYTYTLWGNGDSNSSDYYMKLKWYSGATLLSETNQNISIVGGTYNQFALNNVVAPASSDKVVVLFGTAAANAPTGKFDDADFNQTGAPIPEPASLLLLGSGLVGLLGIGRRKIK